MEISSLHFKVTELRCKCGACNQQVAHRVLPAALERLEQLRAAYGKPLALTSAYRCAKHPSEASKKTPGQHHAGTAFDIRITDGAMGYKLMQLAFQLGFTGIALGNGFVHVDIRQSTPVVWRY